MGELFVTVIGFHLVNNCRLSGESLASASVLLDLSDCPFPGVYPKIADESFRLRSPLKIVQASHSGFVQLAHSFDSNLYAKYRFAGSMAGAYRQHVEEVARQIAARFPASARILEVGCGDGYLIRQLLTMGFRNILGIDPSVVTEQKTAEDAYIRAGFFPEDLPLGDGEQVYDLVICRHVLEHIENPRTFTQQIARVLAPRGELWVEVPDLDSAIRNRMWSNFYQLHCNYFTSDTLDILLGGCGFQCVEAAVVDVFGGSLYHRYTRPSSTLTVARTDSDAIRASFTTGVEAYKKSLAAFAAGLPSGTIGYGAAERTAVTFGHEPKLRSKIDVLCDANSLLQGRYLAGTDLRIVSPLSLRGSNPPAIALFAISHYGEIVKSLKKLIPGDTLVGLLHAEFKLQKLEQL